MIYHFPDLDTLRLAITSGVVPTEVSLAPAKGGLDDDGQVWLLPSVALARKAQTALRRLGVEIVRANGELEGDEFCCWLQLLPIVRTETTVPSPQTPVLFELPDAAQLPLLVGEMLRLGNDRQGFRWLKDEAGSRVLLRVIGPPYYSLLRALEGDGQAIAPRAYIERSPRVWVEFGHTHPLVDKLRPTEGRSLLMRPPRDWTVVEDAAFQDIYDILDFQLPEERVSWRDSELHTRIRVPLRLAPAGTAEPPELWVLRDDAVGQLDTLVRDADDHILQQLAFAVGQKDGQTSIILRVRPSKQAPPVLVLKGETYRPYLKLPNLFLPHGSRLQPPLRRDAIRKLLAGDPDQITWLVAGAESTFTPESLPDAAFRPLRDWVEYVLDRDQAALSTWVQATRFDFASFICKDDQKPTAPKPPMPERKRPAGGPEEAIPVAEVVAKPAPRPVEKTELVAVAQAKPSELQQRLHKLEREFLEAEGALDVAGRQALWPEMAALKAALNQPGDAAVCWVNGLWGDDTAHPAWARQWAAGEPRAADSRALERVLEKTNPEPDEVRAVAARVVAFPEELAPRLASLRQFLEKNEGRLGVRAAWLAWVGLTRQSHDVLGLARTRDRLLERLLAKGLSIETDLPDFLRFSGNRSSDSYRLVRDWLVNGEGLILDWSRNCSGAVMKHPLATLPKEANPDTTLAYLRLILAFGLGRFGEQTLSTKLQKVAGQVLDRKDEVHRFLFHAYSFRISHAVQGKMAVGMFPREIQEEFRAIIGKVYPKGDPDRLAYKAERYRQLSRILDPHEQIDPFLRQHGDSNKVSKALTALADLHEPREFVAHAHALIDSAKKTGHHLYAMTGLLALCHRFGEGIGVQLLDEAVQMLSSLPEQFPSAELDTRVRLIDRGLFLAAHFDRRQHVERFVEAFLCLLHAHGQTPKGLEYLAMIPSQCFRGLRKLGLRDLTSRLLQRMADVILSGEKLDTLRKSHANLWPVTVRTLLAVAAEWLYLGDEESAWPILDEARTLLFSDQMSTKSHSPEKCRLARAYVAALGNAPVNKGLARMEELFRHLGTLYEYFVSSSHYFGMQIELVESVVLAMVSDDFVLGPNARRWLDEDEYLVRRRIHRDLRALMAQAGI